MVDSALVWVSLVTLVSVIGAVAFAHRYVRASEFHYGAGAVAVVFGGHGLELAMTNGHLPGSTLLDAIVGVWAVVAVAVVVGGLIGSDRLRNWSRRLRNDTG